MIDSFACVGRDSIIQFEEGIMIGMDTILKHTAHASILRNMLMGEDLLNATRQVDFKVIVQELLN